MYQRLISLLVTNGPETRPIFRGALALIVLLQVPLYIGIPNQRGTPVNVYYFGGLLLVFIAIILRGQLTTRVLLLATVGAGVALRFTWATVDTASDVFWSNMQACYFVLHGQNPYSQIFTWVPQPANYSWYGYFPFTIFSLIPFYLLGDVRWGLIVYDVATVALLYLLARRYIGPDWAAALAALVLIYIPLTSYTITVSIVDPVMMFWLVLSIYLLTREQYAWAAVAGGLAFASKQYAVLYLLVLLAVFVREKRWREAVILLAVPALIIAPFFLWSPWDFIGNTVQLHLSWTPNPEPFPRQWNVSLWAQGLGVLHDAGFAPDLKLIAGVILLAVLAIVAAVNIWRAGLPQIIGTTTAR